MLCVCVCVCVCVKSVNTWQDVLVSVLLLCTRWHVSHRHQVGRNRLCVCVVCVVCVVRVGVCGACGVCGVCGVCGACGACVRIELKGEGLVSLGV